MQKICISLCIIFTIFTFSCGLLLGGTPERDRVKVEVNNKTSEDVIIYHYNDTTWLIRISDDIVKNNEKLRIYMYTDKIYYAEGYNSKKEYAKRSFDPIHVPSNSDETPIYTWLIEE